VEKADGRNAGGVDAQKREKVGGCYREDIANDKSLIWRPMFCLAYMAVTARV